MFTETVWLADGRWLPFLDLLAFIAGEGLDSGGRHLEKGYRDAFEGGLAQTNELTDHWYTLPLGNINIALLRDDADYVGVQVTAPAWMEREIQLAIHMVTTFIPMS